MLVTPRWASATCSANRAAVSTSPTSLGATGRRRSCCRGVSGRALAVRFAGMWRCCCPPRRRPSFFVRRRVGRRLRLRRRRRRHRVAPPASSFAVVGRCCAILVAAEATPKNIRAAGGGVAYDTCDVPPPVWLAPDRRRPPHAPVPPVEGHPTEPPHSTGQTRHHPHCPPLSSLAEGGATHPTSMESSQPGEWPDSSGSARPGRGSLRRPQPQQS